MAVVWVRFLELPLHTYHSSILNTLGDLVGESIRIDHATREYQRGQFAKIAVEVDLTKPLKGTILFKGKAQKVIYEGEASTSSLTAATVQGSSVDGKDNGSVVCPGVGAWMTAPIGEAKQRRNKVGSLVEEEELKGGEAYPCSDDAVAVPPRTDLLVTVAELTQQSRQRQWGLLIAFEHEAGRTRPTPASQALISDCNHE
ncbi:hypothetical protein Tsubulata_049594 [Turnera subulata]|uniref:DUF4283 domain-containing protein n=1 Tax=Turnera subulata TaxID=218843 RepID=A0A9Q0FXN6_9ROSI|nr:hypothetical protein Tsubulata_049594 [Turnera subulata]